jgi:hypothetical protein
MVRFPLTTPELDEVWSRMRDDEPISEEQFVLLARWAYVNMSACHRLVAVFDLFEHCAIRQPITDGRVH